MTDTKHSAITARSLERAVTRLLVPLDGSSRSTSALSVAAALGSRLHVPVDIVDCVRRPFSAEQEADWAAQRAAAEGLSAGEHIAIHTADDVVGDILASAAAVRGTVLCMASHGRSAVGELLLGSVTHGVVVGSTEPVIVVGPHVSEHASFDTVQICFDGSAASKHAVEAGVAMARQLDVTPWLTQVVEPDLELPDLIPAGDVMETAALGRMAEDLGDVGVDVSWDLLHGTHPAATLVAWAKDHAAGLIVAGSRGRSATQRLVIGSVTSSLIAHATCPVLVTGPAYA